MGWSTSHARKLEPYQTSSINVGDELHSLCEVQELAMVFSVLDTRSDMHDAVHRFQEASLLHQLVSLFETVNSLSLLPGS